MINTILDEYFKIFPKEYLLLILGIGIFFIIIYTIYNYIDDKNI
jgi:uncharacterized membrane protein